MSEHGSRSTPHSGSSRGRGLRFFASTFGQGGHAFGHRLLFVEGLLQERGNLFLAKVALDITAKHARDNIGVLDEASFRKHIWPHRPITDIWGIGPGIAARLAKYGVYDLMGVAALDEEILYRELGVNAEYLIDHAFGQAPATP